jgi:beta-lactamase regulating signal transducer with metallopeptidase domain
MNEQIVRASHYVEIHLLYASMVWLAAWALTSSRRGSATAKYWIWVATSLNFIVPLGAVLDGLGALRPLRITAESVAGGVRNGISKTAAPVASIFMGVWLFGALVMAVRLCLRTRADRRRDMSVDESAAGAHDRSAALLDGVPVTYALNRQAPAVAGVLRPRISLPAGIRRLLSEPELNAVLIHELTHARRRDNLIRLVHEVALCLLWFHPFVWITGARLSLYRELSCDEPVIQSAHGRDLISALAKLAGVDDAAFLQASASSFITDRLARLTEAGPRRVRLASNALFTAVFAAVLLAAAFGTAAQTAGISQLVTVANAPCPIDKRPPVHAERLASNGASTNVIIAHGGPTGGVRGGVVGGVSGGVDDSIRGGVSGGISGGAGGGVHGGVSAGVNGGVAGGVRGGVANGVRGGVSGGASGRVEGGVAGSIRGGVEGRARGGVSGGISHGVSGGVSSGVEGGVSGGVNGGVSGGWAGDVRHRASAGASGIP